MRAALILAVGFGAGWCARGVFSLYQLLDFHQRRAR